MRRTVTSVLSTVAVVAASVAVAAGPADAGGVAVSLADYTDMAVDEAHNTVLITMGDASSEVAVLSLSGAAKTPISGMAGAQDVDLSADGSAFYVSLKLEKAIGVVDATTLAVTKIALGTDICPTSVAQQGTVLWFTYTDCTDAQGNLGSVQLSADGPTVTTALAPANVYPDRVETSPGLAGKAVVRDTIGLTLLDVSAGPLTVATGLASSSTDVADFAITPDGLEVVATDYANSRHVGLSTTNLLQRTVYPSVGFPNAVAVRGDGLVAAGVEAPNDPDVYFHTEGSSALYRSYELAGAGGRTIQRGMAFGATDLYALAVDSSATNTFQRITPKQATTMTLTPAASTINYDGMAKVTIKLSLPGKTVSVYVTPYGGTKRLLKTAQVNSSGYLTVSTALRTRTLFSVTYAGDATHDAVGKSTTIYVRAGVSLVATKVVGTSGSYKLVRAGSLPSTLGTVKPNHAGQCVRFQLQEPTSSGSWSYTQTTSCFKLNSNSQSYVRFDSSWPPGARARVRMFWDGDSRNAAKTTSWVYLKFVR